MLTGDVASLVPSLPFRNNTLAITVKKYAKGYSDPVQFSLISLLCSAVSRAILKPVYRFGIPNSNQQTLKSVDFWYELSSTFVIAEPRERCFELIQDAK